MVQDLGSELWFEILVCIVPSLAFESRDSIPNIYTIPGSWVGILIPKLRFSIHVEESNRIWKKRIYHLILLILRINFQEFWMWSENVMVLLEKVINFFIVHLFTIVDQKWALSTRSCLKIWNFCSGITRLNPGVEFRSKNVGIPGLYLCSPKQIDCAFFRSWESTSIGLGARRMKKWPSLQLTLFGNSLWSLLRRESLQTSDSKRTSSDHLNLSWRKISMSTCNGSLYLLLLVMTF
jgi:hypothetical protein